MLRRLLDTDRVVLAKVLVDLRSFVYISFGLGNNYASQIYTEFWGGFGYTAVFEGNCNENLAVLKCVGVLWSQIID